MDRLPDVTLTITSSPATASTMPMAIWAGDQARERPRPPARPAVQHMQLHRLNDRRQLQPLKWVQLAVERDPLADDTFRSCRLVHVAFSASPSTSREFCGGSRSRTVPPYVFGMPVQPCTRPARSPPVPLHFIEVEQGRPILWTKEYRGLLPSEARELKQLRDQNAKLKRLVADLSLDKAMLQDVGLTTGFECHNLRPFEPLKIQSDPVVSNVGCRTGSKHPERSASLATPDPISGIGSHLPE